MPYLNPPTRHYLMTVGRFLAPGIEPHDKLITQLRPGESLGWHLDRYVFQQVADVTRQSEYDVFREQVFEGVVQTLGFYAAPKELFR